MSEKLNATTLSTRLAERIRQDLLDGVLPPGSRINEVTLSRKLAVSRTPIRAALQRLAGEGLLNYNQNRGFTIRVFPLSEIVGAYEMRSLAEGLAARLAAEHGLTDQARTELENALELGDRILANVSDNDARRAEYADVNEVFHAKILKAADSRIVVDVLRTCHQIPQASTHNIVALEIDDVRERHHFHHRIYDAIRAREPQEAETLMRQHVLGVKASMVRANSRIYASNHDGSFESASRYGTIAAQM